MDNILQTIKKLIGVVPSDDSFDIDITIYINTTLTILSQLGLTEADKCPMIDSSTTWDELLGAREDLEYVKTYICMKCKLLFDPPTSSVAMDALNRTISELEWRIANLSIREEVNNNESTYFIR